MARIGKIQERGYYIWEREGRPDGRDLEHWLRAEAEVAEEEAAGPTPDEGGDMPSPADTPKAPSPNRKARAKPR